ncbi:MAG: hypothetical protein JW819_13235 [Candidatus Krumholzibacteriota bacterium]|nr:hypothetical protein [Candidatus Krumholzibacteriota bacterium]
MYPRISSRVRLLAAALALACLAAPAVLSAEPVPFDAEHWRIQGQVVEFEGRQALQGSATLLDRTFADGVLEVDVYFPDDDARAYPGIWFRMASPTEGERFYIRPHRADLYADALQYCPVINGESPWQLYSGDGYTAAASLDEGRWLTLRLEVKGAQMRVFLGDLATPALEVPALAGTVASGGVFLEAQPGMAYLADFRIEDAVDFTIEAPPVATPVGTITEWEVSQPFTLRELDRAAPPGRDVLARAAWTKVTSTASGLVDVSRLAPRQGREPDFVVARTTLRAERDEIRRLQVGYSDWVAVVLDGRPIWSGNSGYRSRDDSFLGIIGLFDTVHLPLKRGRNELMLVVLEGFGGWGFMARDGEATYLRRGLKPLWERKGFSSPESALWDEERGAIYVSNYDWYAYAPGAGRQFLSKLDADGELASLHWIDGLSNPTGMALFNGRLWAVERGAVVEIDPDAGAVMARHALPETRLANDAAAGEGGLFVSDSRAGLVYRWNGEAFDIWLRGGELAGVNGLCVAGGTLWLLCGDALRAADLATGALRTVTRFAGGGLDGIASDGRGGFLVSQFNGRVHRVSAGGGQELLLDITNTDHGCADIGFAPGRGLLLVPSTMDDTVLAYRLRD